MTTLVELGDYLESLGVGIQAPNVGANLFLGSLPDSPDLVLALYEYPGGAPEYIQNSFFPSREKPQIQLEARANTYSAASELIWKAWSALAPITNTVLGTTYYLSVRPNASPALLKFDTNNRPIMFFNASVDKEVLVVAAS